MPLIARFSFPFRKIIITLWFCVLSLQIWGQAYDIRKFGDDEGLQQPYIYSMVQDKAGFLWLGAGNGLVRFDGVNFRHYTEEDGIAPDFVTQNLVDKQGRIWFGHNSGGVTILESGKFTILDLPEEVVSTVAGIAEDASGTIWVATQRNGLIAIESSGSLKVYDAPFKGMFIYSMQIFKDGRFFIGTSEGIQVFKRDPKGEPNFSYPVIESELSKIERIFPKRDGTGFWVGTDDDGFYELIPGTDENYTLRKYSKSEGFELSRVPVIFEDLEGSVWVGTSGNGFKKYGPASPGSNILREIEPLHKQDSVWLSDIISSVYQDRFGQIWLGTYGNGLIQMVEEMFVLYQPTDQQVFDNIHSVIEDTKGNLWFGTDNGIYVVGSKKIQDHGFHFTASNGMPLVTERHYSSQNGLPKDKISTLFEAPDGKIWIGTKTSGVFILDPETEKIDSFFVSDLALSRCISVIHGDTKKNIWIGTLGGAYVYTPSSGEKQYFNTRNGISHNNIFDIFNDSKGLVWIASHSNRASIYDGSSFSIFPKDNDIHLNNIFSITEDANRDMWLATDGGGAYRFHGDELINYRTENSAMVSNYCYLTLNDKENNIWFAHREGLSRYILKTGTIIPFRGGIEFPLEETTMNAAFRDQEGNLWFGTQNGAVKYNAFYDRFESMEPLVQIEGLEDLESKTYLPEGTNLPFGKFRVRISFLGLTFVNQGDVRYQYRLNDLNWSDTTDQTFVNYEGLAEGEYVFQVKAMNKQGLWNETPAEFRFSISPPFWKTWWFRILGLVVVAGILLGYIRYRTYVLNKEKQVLEDKVRERTSELEMEKAKVEVANLELEKLSLVASETDNAVYILDPKGYLLWVNNGFTRMTGISYAELTEMRRGLTFFETSTNPNIHELMRKVAEEKTSASYESTLPSKDRGTIYVQSTLNPIFDQDGKIKNLVIIDSDITVRKLAEERIQKMNAELEEKVQERTIQLAEANKELEQDKEELKRSADLLQQTNRELDTFIYRASHDLKGPLATLVGLAEIAQMEVTDPVATTYLELLGKSAKKLDDVLLDLLEATKVKQATIVPKELNLEEVVAQTLKEARSKCDPGKTEVSIAYPENTIIRNDLTILHAILFNLIINGFQYRDDQKEPRIDIALSYIENGFLRISVKDNGTGISEKMLPKMFEMFFRGTEKSSGSGLGLYTVRIAVSKIGGNVRMTSIEKEGSEFIAEIPANI